MNTLKRVSVQVTGQRRDPQINVSSQEGFSIRHQKIQPFLSLAPVIQMEKAERESQPCWKAVFIPSAAPGTVS